MRDNFVTDYLILISSDAKKNGYEICKDRIFENLWPIYKKTPQLKNIKANNKVLFYIAGNYEYSQHFVGSANISSVEELNNFESDPRRELKQVICYLTFNKIKLYKHPVNIKLHLKKLKFIKKDRIEKYGLYFQGGICKIDKDSFDYIENQSIL